MKLSLKLIIDELGFEADINIPAEEAPGFLSVELYSAAGADLSGDKLLVCALSEALSAPRRDGLYFLCYRDRMVDDSETPAAMRGITVVRRNIGLSELFNRVQRIFCSVFDWVLKMERSVAANKGLGDLLALSEPVIRNHIDIQDSTFKLLHYTKGIETTDVITSKLIKFGYHPPETVQLFQKYRRLEEYERSHDLIISRDYVTSEYDVVKRMFHIGGSVSIQVVMVCCNRPASDGVVELFRILLDYIKIYADRDTAELGGGNAARSLAQDLIMKNVGTQDEARNRAAYAGFPFEGNFRLLVISFADETNIPISRLVKSFAEVFHRALVFSQSRKVLILDVERGETDQFKAVIDGALPATDFNCGISGRFGCLWDIGIAYDQAVIAVDIAGRLKADGAESPESSPKRVYCEFNKYWLFHLLSAGINAAPVVYGNSFLLRSLEVLRAYDAAHRTDTLTLLRLYLENERKATVVSALMHMHRNTVLYHISKIESLLDVSLDDPEVRLNLQLAYKADALNSDVFPPPR